MAMVELCRAGGANGFQIDLDYEFFAPRFFDFSVEETEEDIRRVERWFENGESDAPSPFMIRIKESRFADATGILCDFESAKEKMEFPLPLDSSKTPLHPITGQGSDSNLDDVEDGMLLDTSVGNVDNFAFDIVPSEGDHNGRLLEKGIISSPNNYPGPKVDSSLKQARTPGMVPGFSKARAINSSTNSGVKKVATTTATSNLKLKTPTTKSVNRLVKQKATASTAATQIAQDNQAIKRQKLEDGKIHQIHNVKNRLLPHKSKADMTRSAGSLVLEQEIDTFVSVAEMVKKFESKTRELNLRSSHHEDGASTIQNRQRLVLTRPREPELRTTHRVRSYKVKSSAEVEMEMLAKIPKFKARPVNKKILEAPTLPPMPKSTPQVPEFREFHLKTLERFEKTCGALSVASSSSSTDLTHEKLLKPSEAKPPLLATALRVRPSRVKTTEEQELEDLEKVPKFKAMPLNKKIFESKGDIGLPPKPKGHLTIPQEFHFATTERLGPPQSLVTDLFDKLSIHSSEPSEFKTCGLGTIPNPFNLRTEERGMEKEKKFTEQLVQMQLKEEKARIPKANPYPYTTDYPVIPPKPQPKECTIPATFQLESIVRLEEKQHRKKEMLGRMEMEEARSRIFKARPIMKEDPIPLPEKERKPLTQVQEIVLHVDHRAEDRAVYDKKMKEKESMHKRLREENEHSKMIEEEKALKQMRKMTVPHARPVPDFSKPFIPHKSSKDKTRPKSPMLRVTRRRMQYIR